MPEAPQKVVDLFESEEFSCYKGAGCGPTRYKLADGRFAPPPYTYAGPAYEQAEIRGVPVPRILAMGTCPSLPADEDLSDEQVKTSMYQCERTEEGFLPGPFSPRCLAANLGRIAFTRAGVPDVTPEEVHAAMAWTNFVKCAMDAPGQAPTERMIRSCAKLSARETEVIGPDLIFCIGRMVFAALFQALHEAGWKLIYRPRDVWDYTFGAQRNGQIIGAGMFFQHENQIVQNRRWKMIRNRRRLRGDQRDPIYDLLDELLNLPAPGEDYEQTVEETAEMERWWSEGVYAYGHQTNPLSACLGVGVVNRLVDEWKGS